MVAKEIVHQFSAGDESQIEALTKQILSLANSANADSALFAAAMADVLAIMAATLDREVNKQSLDERLHTFTNRVEQKYVQVVGTMERMSWNPNGNH